MKVCVNACNMKCMLGIFVNFMGALDYFAAKYLKEIKLWTNDFFQRNASVVGTSFIEM